MALLHLGTTLFVYNIGPECTELDLYQLFGPYGAVTNARVQVIRRGNGCHG